MLKVRATDFRKIDNKLYQLSYTMDDVFFHTLFLDGSEVVGLFQNEATGNLFKATIELDPATDDIILGNFEEVKHEFVSVSRSHPVVRQDEQGVYRYARIAGVSTINAHGEIDSRQLFDSFISRFNPDFYKVRSAFYHLAEYPEMTFGTVTGLHREGNVLVETGVLDDPDENPLARAAVKSFQEAPDVWGASICFLPLSWQVEEIDGVERTIYTDGLLLEISTVKSTDASHPFTRMLV